MRVRRSFARMAAVAMLACVMVLASASLALASPGPVGEPTLGLAALQQKLTDSGPLEGYMKTVVSGSKIETIPVEVKEITGDSLILFEASGDKIKSYGGIVAGMSGSPIYVLDDGEYKVIGAVSYGNYFTIGGTGLATPIESMLQLISDYSPRTLALTAPVLSGGKVIDSVIISAHPENFAAAAAAGAFVAKPLAVTYIGGLRPGTQGYEKLFSNLTAKGMTVVRTGGFVSAGTSTFATDLVPGAAIGALATRGDMWVGGLGTVTYADGPEVLAFGHPSDWAGATSLYMTNAWITGVWPSLYVPTKLGYPSAIRGTITQDRNAGIMGEIGSLPAEAPVTADVTDADTGRTATSNVWMSSKLLDDGSLSGAVGSALSVAGYKLYDTLYIAGSASTTATVVVSDGVNEYTVVIPNVYDDSMDVVYEATYDAENAVDMLESVLDDGIETPHIVSVHLDATVTSHRSKARIVGVNLLAPLHEGENTVRVSLLAYGIAATQTVDTVVTVPEESPLTGQLVATNVNASSGWIYEDPTTQAPAARESIAEIVGDLRATEPNNMVDVAFVPSGGSDSGLDESDSSTGGETTVSIEATASTPWYLSGTATTQITEIDAGASMATFGRTTWVSGVITGPTAPVEVKVYAYSLYSPRPSLVATAMAEMVDGEVVFDIPVNGLTSSTEMLVAVDGGPGYTPAECPVYALIRARVSLSVADGTIRRGQWASFTARIAPRANGGSVTFQYYDKAHKKWRKLITRRFAWEPMVFGNLALVSPTSTARCQWRAPRGTWKVRAVYSASGSDGIMGATSSSVTLKVR